MSDPTPTENTEPLPAVRPPSKLLTLVGLLIFLAGLIVARVLRDSDASLATDLGDILKAFGVVVASMGGPLPIPDALKRSLGAAGSKLLAVLVAGGILSVGSLLGGCATSDSGQTLRFRLANDPARAKPACLYELAIDGRVKHRGAIAECPVVPVCEDRP